MQQSLLSNIRSKLAVGGSIALNCPDPDDLRVLEKLIHEVFIPLDYDRVYVYDLAHKFRTVAIADTGLEFQQPQDLKGWKGSSLLETLNWLEQYRDRGVFIFLDFHRLISAQSPEAIIYSRYLKSIAASFTASGRCDADPAPRRLILIGEDLALPSDLQGHIARLEIGLPSAEEIEGEIETWMPIFEDKYGSEFSAIPPSEWTPLIRSAQGLTMKEVVFLLRESAESDRAIGQGAVDRINDYKVEKLRQMGIHICNPPKVPFGGLGRLRAWLERRIALFAEPGEDDLLRGVLTVGIPGTGKSLVATTIGQMLGIPTFLLQADAIFGSLVGQSEQKMRQILKTAEAVAPCCLWIDEIEKLFASSSEDSTGRKVMGLFLTWMQEKKGQVFVVATANQIDLLPPELLRKGRFDEIFFVDLPNISEREEIAAIHLKKRGTALEEKTIAACASGIAGLTEGFSGSEIAEAIKEADLDARLEGRRGVIDWKDLKRAIEATVPLARQQPHQIERYRNAAKTFLPASLPVQAQAKAGKGRSRVA